MHVRSIAGIVAIAGALLALPPKPAQAQSAVKLKATGTIVFTPGAPSPFSLSGEASHLGKCEGMGEVTFEPGPVPGSLLGSGVADLEAANGDHIVGVVTWTVNPDGKGQIHIAWRDSVQFSDGSIAYSTGRFAVSRPPGIVTAISTSQSLNLLVVIAIIAILIGL